MEAWFPDSLIGQRLEHYDIEELLGVGGMAHVYLARDTLLGREVAIKALAPEFLTHDAAIERFRREAQRVAALEHPHIAPVLHMIEEGHHLYLVMPLFVESLRERLQRPQRLEMAEAVRLVSEVGSALAIAHAQGLVHRDVKPGNILLDQDGKAFLCDFGVACKAKVTDDADTLTLAGSGLPVGTPLYMAPEQLRGDELDHRADIYALGVVLYQALTGRTPHSGNSLIAIATAALTNPIIPPSALNPAVSAPVERVILRALSRRPEDRYPNVARFVEALQAAAQNATKATPLTMLAPLWRSKQSAVQSLRAISQRRSPHIGWPGLTVGALALTLALAGGLAFAAATETPRAVGPTAYTSGSGYERALIPAATEIPTATATQAPKPKPTKTPSATNPSAALPPLSMSALHLGKANGHGHECSGSQTITNTGVQPIAWQWVTISPAPDASMAFSVNTSRQVSGLPANRSPGVAPGGADHLNVRMKCAGQTFTVTLRDSLGRTQQITVTSESSGSSDSSGHSKSGHSGSRGDSDGGSDSDSSDN
ncbi:MAG TPA: serine/threonine-protein kinase [Ktedonobacterales bacterium]|jgi:serine/threonine protein kinase|nr:serine/threonine-protein kinase [Ktedonobacterales bacterium]